MDYLEDIKSNETLIVSFGGYAHAIGGIQPFEFLNFLKVFDTDKLYLKDSFSSSYHKGVKGISTDVDTTVEYLRNYIKRYSKVLFIGNSGGGYAAVLFGSLLNVEYVLAFVPTTILIKNDKDPRYKNLKPLINLITEYHIYGDTSVTNFNDPHHIHHCENINNFVKRINGLNLKKLRDSGELYSIINNILT